VRRIFNIDRILIPNAGKEVVLRIRSLMTASVPLGIFLSAAKAASVTYSISVEITNGPDVGQQGGGTDGRPSERFNGCFSQPPGRDAISRDAPSSIICLEEQITELKKR
jgi:hypothetical protein